MSTRASGTDARPNRRVIRIALLAACVGLAASSSALVATADPGRPQSIRLRASRSEGLPWDGRLVRAVRLEPSAAVRYAGAYAAADNFWGTWELVQLVQRAGAHVARRHPGARLTVGELSRKTGGEIPGHASHENGRDVDLAFYMLDGAGRPHQPWAFAAFRADGTAPPPNEGLRFDDARNWELVARLLTDADARVQFIFVSRAIQARLLAQARRARAPARILERARQVMVQPSGAHPHANHFHVRIYCPPDDRPRCQDRPPFWPWYPGFVGRPLGDPPVNARAAR